MMHKAQKGMAKWVVRILLGLLILSFAMWGIADYATGPTNPPVATVGDREILSSAFIDEAQRRIRIVGQQQNRAIDTETAIAAGLYAQSLSAMIDRNALLDKADSWNLGVSDDTVAENIRNDPTFQGPAGNFDRVRFDQIMRNAGFSEAQYIANLRQDLINRQIEDSLTAGLEAGQEHMARAILAYQLEARDVTFIEIGNDTLADAAVPTEDQLKAYHEENAAQFSTPERRSARVLLVRPADLTANIIIDEQPIQTAYQNRIAQYTTPASRQISQAIFQDEAAAAAALARVNEGVTFQAVIEETTGAPPVDLGTVTPDDLPGPVGEAAFAADPGGIAGPVQSAFGWHLIQIGEATPETIRPLEEVREEIVRDLKLEEAQEQMIEIANRIEDELAGGGRVPDVAAAIEMQPLTLTAVSRDGEAADGSKPAEDLPPAVLELLFGTQPGDELHGQELDNGTVVLVETMAVEEPAVRPLTEVRDAVAAAWKADQLADLAAAEREKLMQRLEGGETLEALAADLGVEPVTETGITRRSGAPALGGPAREQTFGTAAGGHAGGASPSGASQLLVRIDALKPAEIGTDDPQIDGLSETIGAAFSEDVRSRYLEALREEAGVSINQSAYRNAVDPNGIYLN
ncbi:MAG: SurA N-terminal domain-containing protein [Minwuia sp.]|uniref:SurA N-terminal domain-containing protein n=1 Tax=Minwuia sp. TaxID=2493630 RepID=UPI003A8BB679